MINYKHKDREFQDSTNYIGSFSRRRYKMGGMKDFVTISIFLMFSFFGCATTQPKIPMDLASSQPGTQVSYRGNPLILLGSPISVGKPLPSVEVVDAASMKNVDLSKEKGSVLILSIVPSLDTPVCEEQTHYLGEKGDRLPGNVRRIVISRDTPFAQKRFAKEAKLADLQYLSDYKHGDFGRSTGLLTEGLMLLARSVIIVDKEGTVRYIQVVPEMSHLPDMEKAFEKAVELAK
jgi:thiol peroxidase